MNLAEDPRAVGEVRRYHTWAVHRDQSVGEHTWQVMRLLLTVWPDCPRNAIVHALMHDGGEMAGDIQYPFKVLFPELRAGSDKAESFVREMQRKTIGAPETKHPLTQFERTVVKLCDNLEMWEFGLREMNMGNLYGKIVVERMMEAVSKNITQIEVLSDQQAMANSYDVLKRIKDYMATRAEMETING